MENCASVVADFPPRSLTIGRVLARRLDLFILIRFALDRGGLKAIECRSEWSPEIPTGMTESHPSQNMSLSVNIAAVSAAACGS